MFFWHFPGMVFAIAAASVLKGGLFGAVAALALISWPKYARIVRSQVMSIKNAPYIEAARLAGSGTGKIILKHMIPNIAGPVITTAVLDIGTMMMEIAGLSFLGLGAMPPAAEWGSMMSNGRSMLSDVALGDPGAGMMPSFLRLSSLTFWEIRSVTCWIQDREKRRNCLYDKALT